MLEHIVSFCMLLALILYALMGGADYGGGMWDLLARGPRAARQRKAIAEAIGPVWEANHVWLILVIVVLFTGFPRAFTTIMTALNIPVTLMLVGIVLRGSAFTFRTYDRKSDRVHHRWSTVFGAASFFTPFFQGVIIGALAAGRIHVVDGQVVTGFFEGWLTFFAFSCGVFTLGLFSFMAATYLTVETQHQPDLQNDFRRRALWSGLALAPVAGWVLLAARHGAPQLFEAITNWWAPILLGVTSLFAIGALVALWFRWFTLARIAVVGQVTLILAGWALAQYPYLVTPDVTIQNAHAPAITLRLLVIALGFGAMILLPSLAFLFHVFKGKKTDS